MSNHSVLTTTCQTSNDRDALIKVALSTKLAACVQVSQVTSHYVWQNEQQQSEEYLLTFKTRTALIEKLITELKAVHSYKVPEIIVTPITGLPAYLQWIDESTQ